MKVDMVPPWVRHCGVSAEAKESWCFFFITRKTLSVVTLLPWQCMFCGIGRGVVGV